MYFFVHGFKQNNILKILQCYRPYITRMQKSL